MFYENTYSFQKVPFMVMFCWKHQLLLKYQL